MTTPTGHAPLGLVDAPSAEGAAQPHLLSPAASAAAANRVIKRRAPVACRRCRRMRSKCLHSGARPPCEGCRIAGVGLEECVFPSRGTPDLDREYRHPRMKGDKARKENAKTQPQHPEDSTNPHGPLATPSLGRGRLADVATDPWDLLPPVEHVIEAVNKFTYQYFQLGFIPRRAFAERLQQDPRSISPFLLFGVLSVSARLTESLVAIHGDAETAAEFFMSHASALALRELYAEPTLSSCQAFYLLSLAQQGSGYKNKSYINLGVALRMAILMQLHREETYILKDGPTPSMVRKAESARRTVWMIYSQDNLHAAPSAPVSLAASDISALLPCNEHDFENGILPKTRAALEDTQPAIENPFLVNSPDRSLFATLIQSHHLWGIVSRRAVRNAKCADPWASTSEYAKIQKKLRDWEDQLPPEHRWSTEQFKKAKSEAYDLAYLIVPMVTRLCNIVIRKTYLPDMLKQGGKGPIEDFWSAMSENLFSNVKDLFTQIDVWFQGRQPGDSTGAQMAIFCVYSCGLMSAYLCNYPHVCHKFALEGRHMLDRTVDILGQSKTVWPLARRWLASLERFSKADQKSPVIASSHLEGSMADGKDPIPSALHPPLAQTRLPGPRKTFLGDKPHAAKPQLPSPKASERRPSLPPPLPSPGLVAPTIPAAPHYSTAPPLPSLHAQAVAHAQQPLPTQLPAHAQLQHPLTQPPLSSVPPAASPSVVAAALPQMRGQSQAQDVPPPAVHRMLVDPVTGLAGVSSAGMAPATAHDNIDLLVRAFDTSSSGLALSSADMAYTQPPLQGLLADGTAGAAVVAVGTLPPAFYDGSAYVTPVNDGFESELAFMMAGTEGTVVTPWTTELFRY